MALTDNLSAYWKFNEAAGVGTVADSKSTLTGTVFNATQGVAGKFGNGISFDGVGDYVSFGDVTSIDSNESFSLSFWLKIGVVSNKTLIGKKSANSHTAGGWCVFFVNHRPYFEMNNAQAWNGSHLQVSLNADVDDSANYHHYVITYDGSRTAAGVHFYFDSVDKAKSVDSDTLGVNSILNADALCIGGFNGDTSWITAGGLDEMALWEGKVLSQAEVDTLYNAGAGYEMPMGPDFTKMQLQIGDAWKSGAGMQVNIGDAWKQVAGMQVNIGDAWKTVF